jgi:hypothetical protein
MKDASEDIHKPSEPAGHDTAAESPARDDPKPPSPSPAGEDTTLPEVAITGTGQRTPEPYVLSRHSGKAEASLDRIEFELPVLEKLTADELHAGFLNRLNSSRNMELKLVNLMKKKYEVICLLAFPLYPSIAAKSWFSIANNRPGLPICIICQVVWRVAPKYRVSIDSKSILIVRCLSNGSPQVRVIIK